MPNDARFTEVAALLGDTTRTAMLRALLDGRALTASELARTCYDHLAGRLGVAIADALAKNGHIALTADSGVVTANGERLLQHIGIDLPALTAHRGGRARMLCRPCLDWSERRPRLDGTLGAALCTLRLAKGWIRWLKDTRAILITTHGRLKFRELLDVRLEG